jgi:phospholipid/cholesterol/gamma-HCH transport system substrate-binding protein
VSRRPGTSLAASPVLVGTVTVLVTFIAVFIAYNANAGLPFVPTYNLRAELPSGGKLVKGNDVRVGGFRVGVVTKVEPAYRRLNGRRRAVALVELKLDQTVKPLSEDTRLRVRPRSALGLKYVELTPGSSERKLAPGSKIALENNSEPLELEDIFGTFKGGVRSNARDATERTGDAFAGRGPALNDAIAALRPALGHLVPVMRTLSDPDTRLRDLLPNVEGTLGQVAPVASTASALFTDMADTFDALSRNPAALQATIERTPPTLEVAGDSLRVSRPVLASLADLVRRLRPAAAELPRSAPRLTSALRVGTPVLARSIALSRRLQPVGRELRDLVRNPATLMSLRDLRTVVQILRPAVEYIAPYQTVCNYTMYFVTPLGEHQSQPGPGGTVEPQFAKIINFFQPNSPVNTVNSRPWDLPPGQAPQDATFAGLPAGRVLGTPFFPAIDAQGNADCQNGQVGYPNGRLIPPYARHPGQSDPNDPNDVTTGTLTDGTPAGGNAAVAPNDYPGLVGGTYKARELGIGNLKDVP